MATDTYVNDSGTWRKPSSIYANDGGTWRDLSKVYVNQGGIWRKVFEKSAFPTSGLVSYWKSDANGSFPDAVGSHTGTIQGATYNASGKINGAYDYVTNDNVVTDISSDWNGGTNNAFTISFWAYCNAWDVAQTFASNFQYLGSGNSKGWTINLTNTDSGYVRFRIADVDTCRYATDISGGWHYITGTYDGTNARLYVDGDLKDTDAVTHNIDSPHPLSFGAWENAVGGKGEYFNGTLDEIGFWDRALTQTEITTLYNGGSGFPYS